MEWPRKSAKGAKQSFWQEKCPNGISPGSIPFHLGSSVFFAPFRG
jgi:hypothetical protein